MSKGLTEKELDRMHEFLNRDKCPEYAVYVDRLISQAREANRLREALKIAKENWDFEKLPDEYNFICAALDGRENG